MQPKVNHLRFPRKFTPGDFPEVLSPNIDVSFDLRPPKLVSGTRVLHGTVPRVRDPDTTKAKPSPISTKIYIPGVFWDAESEYQRQLLT